MTNILPDSEIAHLDFETPIVSRGRPQSEDEFINQVLQETDLDRRGMSRRALVAFATAKGITDRLAPGDPPTLVRDLMEHPGAFNDMVLIGIRHFNQASEPASGVE